MQVLHIIHINDSGKEYYTSELAANTTTA